MAKLENISVSDLPLTDSYHTHKLTRIYPRFHGHVISCWRSQLWGTMLECVHVCVCVYVWSLGVKVVCVWAHPTRSTLMRSVPTRSTPVCVCVCVCACVHACVVCACVCVCAWVCVCGQKWCLVSVQWGERREMEWGGRHVILTGMCSNYLATNS